MRLGEETVALGIVYLIRPSLVREWRSPNMHKVKSAASKIYGLYIGNKGATKN